MTNQHRAQGLKGLVHVLQIPILAVLSGVQIPEIANATTYVQVDAVLVATGRAPYTTGLGLANVNVETDRRGFVPVTEKMEVI